MNITELKQLVAVGELESFSEVARRFYVSTPTVTRAMKRIERCYGVELFVHGKNKVELNDAGRLAVAGARRILREIDASIAEVRAYDRSLRTIDLVSCAPAPLWVIAPRASQRYPGMALTTRVANLEKTREALEAGDCDVAVLPYRPKEEGVVCSHVLDEHLLLCVPRDHMLAGRERVSLEEMNGFNFLLGIDLGFWNDVVRKRLPASRFLVQDDEFSLAELIRTSTLPCFATDVSIERQYRDLGENRVGIPITDPEVNVSFWLVARKDAADKVSRLF